MGRIIDNKWVCQAKLAAPGSINIIYKIIPAAIPNSPSDTCAVDIIGAVRLYKLEQVRIWRVT